MKYHIVNTDKPMKFIWMLVHYLTGGREDTYCRYAPCPHCIACRRVSVPSEVPRLKKIGPNCWEYTDGITYGYGLEWSDAYGDYLRQLGFVGIIRQKEGPHR